jgi:hypothetical protein
MRRKSTVLVGDKSQEVAWNESRKGRYYDRNDITNKAIQIFYTDGIDQAPSVSVEGKVPFFYFVQILHPNGNFRRFFDFLTVGWVLYCVFIVPFQVGFDWYIMSAWEKTVMNMLDIWFAIDILLNFRTGFISHGTVVMHPNKIAK